ncbi:MAG: hypothetical protein D6732_15620 [Methanobacteriota archaeon]|nr:MAG: hypothetical protein D6732_15620 [Euryarchaeota archaeon]
MKDEVDHEKLKLTALNAWEVDDRVKAVKKIKDQDFLLNLVLHDLSGKVRQAALEGITDENHLVLVAMRSKHEPLRALAIEKLTSETSLLRIIDESDFPTSRKAAFEKLYTPHSLATVAIKEGGYLGKKALEKIEDLNLLLEIAEKSKDIAIKWASLEKIQLKDPLLDLNELFFAIASSVEFELEDRMKAAQSITTPELLYKLILVLSKELPSNTKDLLSMNVDISLSNFLDQTIARLPEAMLEKILHDPSLPKSVRIITFPHFKSSRPIMDIVEKEIGLVAPAFAHLVNYRKEQKLASALFMGFDTKTKMEVLQTPLNEQFLSYLLKEEHNLPVLARIAGSFRSSDSLKKAMQTLSTEKLTSLRNIPDLREWIIGTIDEILKTKTKLEFESPEEAFNYLKDHPDSQLADNVLQFLIDTPYLLKVLDLHVPLKLKKKVVELVPDPLDLQILLLTSSDDELKSIIRLRLGE